MNIKLKHMPALGLLLILLGTPLWSCSSGGSATDDHDHDHDHETAEHAGGEIELTQRQKETVGIEFGHFRQMELSSGLNANGVVSLNPSDMADISPVVPGIVRQVNVAEGQYVKAGAVVATIENLDIMALQQDYGDARIELRQARAELDRQEALAREGAGVRKNLDKARFDFQMAENRLAGIAGRLRMAGVDMTRVERGELASVASVTSPVSGTVTKINVTRGSYADTGTPMMTVSDNSRVFVSLTVYEKDLGKIRKGAGVDLFLTNGDASFEGIVEDVNGAVDSATKGVTVRVKITDPRGATLLPGMAVNAFVNTGSAQTDVLPEGAVVSSGGRDYIYIVKGEAVEDGEKVYLLKPVEVVAGTRCNGMVAVSPIGETGPEPTVVTAKAFYVASMAADHGEHNH